MSPLRWTVKSTRVLAAELIRLGHQAGSSLVGRMLYYLAYRLPANAKITEGAQHPDRDAQFRHINATAAEHLAAGQPVISVDCKKKELVADYANGGAEWEPAASPRRMGVHDLPDPEMGKAIPYGVYDLAGNEGWVNVGDHHDTPAFAVASIARWWERMGKARYPDATRLMITADAGGSNDYRSRAFKTELANPGRHHRADHHRLPHAARHLEVEHRAPPVQLHLHELAGKAATTYRTVVELIAATTTQTGLTVQADFDEGYYPTGVQVTDAELAAVPITWRGTTSTPTGTTPSSRRLRKAQQIAARGPLPRRTLPSRRCPRL